MGAKLIDITHEYYDDELIEDILDRHVPLRPKILYNRRRKRGRELLKSYRMYDVESLKELVENYEFLNRKIRLGVFDRRSISRLRKKKTSDISMQEVQLYNQYARPERRSNYKNVTYIVLEELYVNIDPDSFVRKESFELCELQLMTHIGDNEKGEYFPSSFVYRDDINGSDNDNAKNTAMLEIILESGASSKYDMTLQTMDEDYEIEQKGFILSRGKRLRVVDIGIHEDEGYLIPECEPLLVSVFR